MLPEKNPREYKELLLGGRWFSSLPPPFQDALLSRAVVKTLAGEERLFSRAEAPSGMYAVLEGAIRVTGSSENGKEALLALSEPPSWFGEIAVIDGLPR